MRRAVLTILLYSIPLNTLELLLSQRVLCGVSFLSHVYPPLEVIVHLGRLLFGLVHHKTMNNECDMNNPILCNITYGLFSWFSNPKSLDKKEMIPYSMISSKEE